MIVDSPVTLDDMKAALQFSKYRFYLTGSRYFGHCRHDSDWDFFVQDDVNIYDSLQTRFGEQHNGGAHKLTYPKSSLRCFLQNLGFEIVHASGYRDKMMTTVFRHTKLKIDIQIVKSADVKYRAQQKLYACVPLRMMLHKLDKYQVEALWDWAFRMVTGVEYDPGYSAHNETPFPEANAKKCIEKAMVAFFSPLTINPEANIPK